jgi:hypothetical protein
MSDLKDGPNAMWEHRVRQRAYEIYEARLQKGLSSSEVLDWLEAERDVLGEIRGSQELRISKQQSNDLVAQVEGRTDALSRD